MHCEHDAPGCVAGDPEYPFLAQPPVGSAGDCAAGAAPLDDCCCARTAVAGKRRINPRRNTADAGARLALVFTSCPPQDEVHVRLETNTWQSRTASNGSHR